MRASSGVWNVRVQGTGRNRRLRMNGMQHGHQRVGVERMPARGHFIENDSEGKHVGGGRYVLAAHLFRRHIGDRS